MKNLLILCITICCCKVNFAQLKIGNNPVTINDNSLLELEHTSKGLLLPRLSLTATTNASPLSANIAGMVIYNTVTINDVTPGYYYNDGSKWVRLLNTTDVTALQPWYNVATGAPATSNSQNIYQMGNVGVRIPAPLVSLHVNANSVLAGATNPYRAGIISEAEGTSVGGRLAARTASAAEMPMLIGYRSRGTLAAPAAVQNGDDLLRIVISGYNGTDWSAGYPIYHTATEGWTSSANGFATAFRTAANGNTASLERMRIDQNGNVGIGTTSPSSLLHILGAGGINKGIYLSSAGGTSFQLFPGVATPDAGMIAFGDGTGWKLHIAKQSDAGATKFVTIDDSGNLEIGITSPAAKLSFPDCGADVNATGMTWYNPAPTQYAIHKTAGTWTAPNYQQLRLGWSTGVIIDPGTSYGKSYLEVQGNGIRVSSGTVGIGTTSTTAVLHVAGTVRFSSFGAGTVVTDANGNISVSSDERLKKNIRKYSRGISAIMRLQPATYNWNEQSGLDTKSDYTGFIAQNVQQFIPEAVMENNDGMLSLQDRPILATLVNAMKEQQQQMEIRDRKLEVLRNQVNNIQKELNDLKELIKKRN